MAQLSLIPRGHRNQIRKWACSHDCSNG